MAEILLIFPPDKQAAAAQMQTALGSAGYSAVLEAVAEPDGGAIARKAAGCAAALLIWSRPLAAAADLGGWAAGLRRLPNLIEVSTDGIAPQSGDDRRVVLLSGWRGQPFHLGWQRVLDELESLGARRTAASRAAPVQTAPTAAPAAAGPAREAGAGPRGRRLTLSAAAALALIGAVGAAAWLGSGASDPTESAARAPAAGAAKAPPPSPAPVAVAEPPMRVAQPSPPVGPEASESEPLPAATTEPAPPVRTASARSSESVRPPPKRLPAAAAPIKRYSKKNSRTMRLFCARSGRSTPQCRIFARSTGGG